MTPEGHRKLRNIMRNINKHEQAEARIRVRRMIGLASVCSMGLLLTAAPGHASLINYDVNLDLSGLNNSADQYQYQFFFADNSGTPTNKLSVDNYDFDTAHGGDGAPPSDTSAFHPSGDPTTPSSWGTLNATGDALNYQLHFDYTPNNATPDELLFRVYDATTQDYLTTADPTGAFYTIDLTGTPE